MSCIPRLPSQTRWNLDRNFGQNGQGRRRGSWNAAGFTLLELAVVLFIMGLMISLAMPYLGGFRRAALRSESRRLAGRASYLYDEASTQKVVLQLIFDLDLNGYMVTRLDPYAAQPVFVADHSPGARAVQLPPGLRIRDVSVEGIGTFTRGTIACQFYPEGYVDATLVHLMDDRGDVMTLAFAPLTGQVAIGDGDLNLTDLVGR
jgi:prepilin-type N-terminal cleavage/methylation domain-containing protein